MNFLSSRMVIDFCSLGSNESRVALCILGLEFKLILTSWVSYGIWFWSRLVWAPRSRSTTTCTLKVCWPSTIAVSKSILSPLGSLFLFFIKFFLSCKKTGRACRRLWSHWYHHSISLWSLTASTSLSASLISSLVQTKVVRSSWNRWFSSFYRRLSFPSCNLIFSCSILTKKVPLHLDIDNFSNVFFVVFFDLSNFLAHESLLFLLNRFVWLISLTRIFEDTFQVLLDIFHFELSDWIAVLIFYPFLWRLIIMC